MTESAIHIEVLGKRYRVGERERYFALRDVITRAFTAPFLRKAPRRPKDFLWALRDVSLDVKQGEVVGLIGRNGAGKTTLLKLLSRITRPTTGFAEIHGRVGSLLEVGTGFHPELTGRENIYLCGAILGMRRREIERKRDAIVAFAEVERFLDTPLKHYSTGMQMRLAFAVAAHLEPEILLVDEVLAVGDIEFQKKCLGKMKEVSKSGRTIIFVSHQMNQIRRLCERVIWIDNGSLQQDGGAETVISAYEQSAISPATRESVLPLSRKGIVFFGWEVEEPRGSGDHAVASGHKPVSIRIRVQSDQTIRHGRVAAVIYDTRGFLVAGWSFDNLRLELGEHEISLSFSNLPLRPGAYSLYFSIHDDHQQNYNWTLVPSLLIEGAPVTHFMDEWAGVLNVPCSLSSKKVESNARSLT
jgi:lipopolysaccharide transport system ATP-binding protein